MDKEKYIAWIKKHPVWTVFIALFILGFIGSIFEGTDENLNTNNESVVETVAEKELIEVNDTLTVDAYLLESAVYRLKIGDIHESFQGTLEAVQFGYITMDELEDRMDDLSFESYSNSEKIKKLNPPNNCEKAQVYLKEISAAQWLAINEVMKYTNDFKESRLTKATYYMEALTENINKFQNELEVNCK